MAFAWNGSESTHTRRIAEIPPITIQKHHTEIPPIPAIAARLIHMLKFISQALPARFKSIKLFQTLPNPLFCWILMHFGLLLKKKLYVQAES